MSEEQQLAELLEYARAERDEALDALERLRKDTRGLPYRQSHDDADAILRKHGRLT